LGIPPSGGLSATRSIVRSGNRSVGALVRNLLDPMLVVVALIGAAWLARGHVENKDLVLGLIAFSLSYPGSLSFSSRPTKLFARSSATGRCCVH
jgi:hypothetical protein